MSRDEVAGRGELLSLADRGDIQGWVTSGYGHLRHGAYAFLRFGEGRAARRWLGETIPEVTYANSWRPAPGVGKRRPSITLNLGFTEPGLAALGLGERCRGTFAAEFVEGMAETGRSRALGDVGEMAPETWQFGGPGRGVDAVLVVHAETEEAARSRAEHHLRALEAGGGRSIAVEHGSSPVHGREHFGFRDGIARVDIRGITGRGLRTGEFILGYENETGYHPPTPVVTAADDPDGLLADSVNPHHAAQGFRDLGRNGTYLVYRKLEQDVAGFWGFLERESLRWRGRVEPGFMVWLAAKMVGRWPGGAPLVLSPDGEDATLRDTDDFGYADEDGEGLRCPFGAHIRRTNPRDQIRPAGPVSSTNMSFRHRILRRGKVYGPELFDLAGLEGGAEGRVAEILGSMKADEGERGIHFFCLNASIKGQFEFIQQTWANNPQFNAVTGNPDPLTGSAEPGAMLVPSRGLDLRTAPMPRFVTVRAGGYFFVPSQRALGYLAAERK